MQQAKTFDFIIVGSGIAGLHTALTLAPFGQVLIVTKNKPALSATALAQGGIAAVTKSDDSLASHKQDTLTAGYHHNSKKAVAFLVKNGKKATDRLEKFGVPFDKNARGDFISSFEAAHSYPRILHATDFTGREIHTALLKAVRKQKTITLWEETTAIDLIGKTNHCYGIRVLKKKSVIDLFARAVVLTTGGVGQLYQWTTNPTVSTGDGIAMAHRAGARITDMEFIQFHPTAFAGNTSPLLLLSEALRGEGAYVINAHGERFMKNYHPQAELAPRDVVARAIFQEQKKGTVFLDISHKEKTFIKKRFPNLYRELKKRGFDLTRDSIPVTPAAHFLCGGIATDLYGSTSIKNLFAYGETAATGVHGANRLASNSLLEGMVFSQQIKQCIKELPQTPQFIQTSPLRLTQQPSSVSPNEIRTLMWHYVGILRTPRGLAIAHKKLLALQKKIAKQDGIDVSLQEVKNMLTVALLITQAAQHRKESLGTHFISSGS